jgi:hypothetical protein
VSEEMSDEYPVWPLTTWGGNAGERGGLCALAERDGERVLGKDFGAVGIVVSADQAMKKKKTPNVSKRFYG